MCSLEFSIELFRKRGGGGQTVSEGEPFLLGALCNAHM